MTESQWRNSGAEGIEAMDRFADAAPTEREPRTNWHWQPGDGVTTEYTCECSADSPGCYCDRQTEAENNFLAGWNAAVDRLEGAGAATETGGLPSVESTALALMSVYGPKYPDNDFHADARYILAAARLASGADREDGE